MENERIDWSTISKWLAEEREEMEAVRKGFVAAIEHIKSMHALLVAIDDELMDASIQWTLEVPYPTKPSLTLAQALSTQICEVSAFLAKLEKDQR